MSHLGNKLKNNAVKCVPFARWPSSGATDPRDNRPVGATPGLSRVRPFDRLSVRPSVHPVVPPLRRSPPVVGTSFAGRMDGTVAQSAGRSDDRSIDQSDGLSVAEWIGPLVGRSANQSIGKSVCFLNCRHESRVGRSVARWIVRSVGRSVGWSVDRSVGWSVGRSVGGQLVRSLVDLTGSADRRIVIQLKRSLALAPSSGY